MPQENLVDQDTLLARAITAHAKAKRSPNASLEHSRALESSKGQIFIELRSRNDEALAIYQYHANSGQLRLK